MKVCFALWHLNGYRGTQTWTVAAARAMKTLGHEVSLYCVERGRAAMRLMPEFPIYSMSHVGEVPKQDVLIVAQPRMFHECKTCHRPAGEGRPQFQVDRMGFAGEHRQGKVSCAGTGRRMKRIMPQSKKRIYVCHGVTFWQDAPLKDRSAYIAVSEETQEYLRAHGIQSTVIRQPVDLETYVQGPALREIAPKALTFSRAPAELAAIRDACEKSAIELVEPPETELWDTVPLLHSVDIVIGSGRGLCEAMACGRVAIVCSKYGCDGLVSSPKIAEQLRHNFSGRATGGDVELRLPIALGDYDVALGEWSTDVARAHFDAKKNVEQILEVACSK